MGRTGRRHEFEVDKLEEKLENDSQSYDAMVTEIRKMRSVTLKTWWRVRFKGNK